MISRESRLGYWLNSTFGVRGRNNILAWAISGGLAYYLFILPEQRKAEQRKVSYDMMVAKYEQPAIRHPAPAAPPSEATTTPEVVVVEVVEVAAADPKQ